MQQLRSQQGAKGDTGPAGAKGDKGDAGTKGTDGAPGTARAYVLVNGAGTINAAKSKNVVSVTKPGTGAYCVQLAQSIDATTVEGTVSADYSTAGPATVAYIRSSNLDCGSVTNSINVRVAQIAESGNPTPQFTAETEVAANGGFFLLVP